MASHEASESHALSELLVFELEKLIAKQMTEFNRLISDLNLSKREHAAELDELRKQLAKLNEDIGFNFQRTRIIPRAAAAKLLCRTPRTMKRWEQSRQLEPLYPSTNQVYYRLNQVEALVDSFAKTPQPVEKASGR